MHISGMQKLTLLDYPGVVSCLIFTQGCNFRCPFCHNKDLLNSENNNLISEEEVLSYLKKRKKVLDGVVISGGEPLLQHDLENFMRKVKKLGYKIKLDTNGSNPDKLKHLIDKGLIDYVAMDVKNDFSNYDKTTGIINPQIDKIKKSISIIEESSIDYEFRTTVVKQFHCYKNLENICNYLKEKDKYYIQNYHDCENVLERGLTGFSEKELFTMEKELNKISPNITVREV